MILLVLGREAPEIAALFSLLEKRNLNAFFELFPRALAEHGRDLLCGEAGRELANSIVPHFRGENGKDVQEAFIEILSRGVPDTAERIAFYEIIAGALGASDAGGKDEFLATLCLVEQSREIVRFAYRLADPFGVAHYLAVFSFTTGIIPARRGDHGDPRDALRRPRVTFTAGREVRLVIPPQFFTSHPDNGEVRVTLLSGSHVHAESFTLDLYAAGGGVVTGMREVEIPPWEGTLSVQLEHACGVLRAWEIPGMTEKRPFLAFRARRRTLVTDSEIPRKETWIVSPYPVLYAEGLLERGRVAGLWRDFQFSLIQPLPHCEYYLSFANGGMCRIPFKSAGRSPSLAGTLVEYAIFDPPLPWYTDVPRLIVPMAPYPDEAAGTIEIFREYGTGVEEPLASFSTGTAGEYARMDDRINALVIDLSHGDLLGTSAAGLYIARFSAWEAPLRFGIAPGLRVFFHPPVFLPGGENRSLEVEVEGPDIVEPLSPCEVVREGLFRLPAPTDPNPAASTVAFRLVYRDAQRGSPTSLTVRIKLPIVRCTLAGLSGGHEPIPLGGGVTLMRETLEDALGTAEVIVERPRELLGNWILSVGEQESRRNTVDDEGNLHFPLEVFREVILAHRNGTLPVTLAHEGINDGVRTQVDILSLVDWTVEYTDSSVEFREGRVTVTVSWRERGRSGEATFVLTRNELGIPSGEELSEGVRVEPSGTQWKEYSASFTFPFADTQIEYTMGFARGDSGEGEWALTRALQFPQKIRVGSDPLAIAEWYYRRGDILASLKWLKNVCRDHPRYADALVLRARCLSSLADGAPTQEEVKGRLTEAIGVLADALATGADGSARVLKAHLHNRLGILGDGDCTPFRKAEEILGELLGRNPHDIPALAEYGIALAGMGRILEAAHISRYLDYLDPGETIPETAYAKAVILRLFAERVKGKVSERDQKEIGRLLARARELGGCGTVRTSAPAGARECAGESDQREPK
ncbi:MAG: hypothetical protein QFX32_05905 [Methanolinea sp.]|nr:hypothetical protein [Methanolinea sp.]